MQVNRVLDAMPGYARSINQRTTDVGSYAQVQIAPASPVSLALGMRADVLRINGAYDFDASSRESINTTFVVVNPRLSLIGRLSDDWQIRTSYATGFRGPQAFDEDLHISTLQGAARLIRLDPSLRPERSHSVTLSLDGTSATSREALGVTADFFATLLTFPFVTGLIADSLPGTVGSVALKTNGDAAFVAGSNLEFRLALARTFELTTTVTLQRARYVTAQVVAESDDGRVVSTPDILRTPDIYASAIASWTPIDALTIDASCIITGPMWVVNERIIERRRTPSFADMGLRGAYDVHIDGVELRVGIGLVNLLNAYQLDLERGPQRDAAYVYGPMRPRTIMLTLSCTWQ
jgi:outer membrane receptor for ferrienterochelin and colicins